MTSTNIHVMGLRPPMTYDHKIHQILLADQIKKDAGWIIAYDDIDYIVGNVWNTLTHKFEPGPGANLVVHGIITKDDINAINNAYRPYDTSGLIFILGHKYKRDYNNNHWYHNDIANTITFDRYSIPKSVSNAPTMNDAPIKSHKNKFKCKNLNNLNEQIQQNIKYNKNINDKSKDPTSTQIYIIPQRRTANISVINQPQIPPIPHKLPLQTPKELLTKNRTCQNVNSYAIVRALTNYNSTEIGILHSGTAPHKSPPTANPSKDIIFNSLGTEILGEDENNNSYSNYNCTQSNSLTFTSTTKHTSLLTHYIINGTNLSQNNSLLITPTTNHMSLSVVLSIPSIKPSLTSNGYVLNDKNVDKCNPLTLLNVVIDSNENIDENRRCCSI